MVLGITRDPGPRGFVFARGTTRRREIARICFAKIAAATVGDGESHAPHRPIWFTDARTCAGDRESGAAAMGLHLRRCETQRARSQDRKSTRLNSSHSQISYAVFCLKKKNT